MKPFFLENPTTTVRIFSNLAKRYEEQRSIESNNQTLTSWCFDLSFTMELSVGILPMILCSATTQRCCPLQLRELRSECFTDGKPRPPPSLPRRRLADPTRVGGARILPSPPKSHVPCLPLSTKNSRNVKICQPGWSRQRQRPSVRPEIRPVKSAHVSCIRATGCTRGVARRQKAGDRSNKGQRAFAFAPSIRA